MMLLKPSGGYGSSPRARGTPLPRHPACLHRRFIPAGAGNTRLPASCSMNAAVHPRGRGEHINARNIGSAGDGSSPRARGTRRLALLSPLFRRFIPAGAGNTRPRGQSSRFPPVHPRGRGEHKTGPDTAPPIVGSSPRARGTRMLETAPGLKPRFIPAGAGNTSISRALTSVGAVHPRGRGEHGWQAVAVNCCDGSSPRARGTQPLRIHAQLQRRFIPAGAGNTVGFGLFPCSRPVHPRGRGEHTSSPLPMLMPCGSSPRARGTPSCGRRCSSSRRFIPAGAGNTARIHYRPGNEPVHPRGRGEHGSTTAWQARASGSSPRARGTQLPARQDQAGRRFIPAGAGNTCGGSPE